MTVDYQLIPEHMRAGIRRYIETGKRTGGFLNALLSNDLMDTYGRGDLTNLSSMANWMRFLYQMPPGSYGSPANVKAWREAGGLAGHTARAKVPA